MFKSHARTGWSTAIVYFLFPRSAAITLLGFWGVSQSQLLICWLKSKRKGVASALTVNQAEASSVLDIVKAIAVGDVFIEEHE